MNSPAAAGIGLRRKAVKYCVENWKNTHQSVKLGDTNFIWVHHAELLPGHQVQAELPVTQRFTRYEHGGEVDYVHIRQVILIVSSYRTLWWAEQTRLN